MDLSELAAGMFVRSFVRRKLFAVVLVGCLFVEIEMFVMISYDNERTADQNNDKNTFLNHTLGVCVGKSNILQIERLGRSLLFVAGSVKYDGRNTRA